MKTPVVLLRWADRFIWDALDELHEEVFSTWHDFDEE